MIKNFNRRDRVVKRKQIPQGIDLCKVNVRQFLEDGRLLIDSSSLSHAYISVQYALEELGKILIFRDKIAKDSSDPLVITYQEAFKSHDDKIKKALQFIGQEYEKVFKEGVFDEGVVEKGVVLEDTCVRDETRQDCAFVDYYGLLWRIGRDIEKDLLIRLIARIEERLPYA